jgi:hypothetical protein
MSAEEKMVQQALEAAFEGLPERQQVVQNALETALEQVIKEEEQADSESEVEDERNERHSCKDQVRALILDHDLEAELPDEETHDESEELEGKKDDWSSRWQLECKRRPPSFSTFYRARWHPEFNDVATRPKHTHCRCKTCYRLNTMSLRKWLNEEQREGIEAEKKAHRRAYRQWRELEKSCQYAGLHCPRGTLVLSFDDTVALGLPRLTNRPVKGVPPDRLQFVPSGLVDHSSGALLPVHAERQVPEGSGSPRYRTVSLASQNRVGDSVLMAQLLGKQK